jgi:FAD/FMN-containing dehydrogenase
MAQELSHAAGGAALDQALVQEFESKIRGTVLTPGHAEYDAARAVQNGLIDRRPAIIVRCSGAADVIDAVNFARDHQLLLSVRGGGHNVAGNAINDGGLVIDLSLMRGVHVDPRTRTALVQGGATWADVDRETQLFGLAAPGGVVSTTGVAGLTLHGGVGHLRRKYGLSLDNLLSVDIVTADGKLQTASATENPDLFWAVRGAGSNFGAVVSFEFQLHPVGPMVALCAPVYSLDDGPAVLAKWRDFMATAPEEVNSLAVPWSAPPGFPEELVGRPVVIVAAVYCGPVEEGERIMRPLRELATPLIDLSGPEPFTAVQSSFDAFFPKGRFYYWKGLYVDGLSDELIAEVCRRAAERPSSLTDITIWHHGGAMSRVPADQTAFGVRNGPFFITYESTWEDPAETERNISWTREAWQDLHRYSSGGVYLNFQGFGEEKEDLLRAAYGGNYERLRSLKAKYDPGNLFRMNQNIAPPA